MKTILVTGANGYIGRHIIDALLKKQTQIIAIDITHDTDCDRIKYIKGDIFDDSFDLLAEVGSLDCCLHLAWRSGFNHNDIAHMADLSSHYLFLKKLIDGGVPQIAVMGTMHEIGYWEGAIDENTPCNPQSLYGIAKDCLRRSLMHSVQNASTKALWLRAFYILGDEARSQSVFGKLMRAAWAGEKSFPFTSGKCQYDFIQIEDLADQIAACVVQDEIEGIINCCSGRPVALGDRAEEFIRNNNLEISLEYGAYPDRPYDSPAIWGDATKINTIMKKNQQE